MNLDVCTYVAAIAAESRTNALVGSIGLTFVLLLVFRIRITGLFSEAHCRLFVTYSDNGMRRKEKFMDYNAQRMLLSGLWPDILQYLLDTSLQRVYVSITDFLSCACVLRRRYVRILLSCQIPRLSNFSPVRTSDGRKEMERDPLSSPDRQTGIIL